MSRKDFVAVAAAINLSAIQLRNTYAGVGQEVHQAFAIAGLRAVAINLANTFGDANPRFNRNIFLAACGVSGVNGGAQ
jgi:hypothetical protein